MLFVKDQGYREMKQYGVRKHLLYMKELKLQINRKRMIIQQMLEKKLTIIIKKTNYLHGKKSTLTTHYTQSKLNNI